MASNERTFTQNFKQTGQLFQMLLDGYTRHLLGVKSNWMEADRPLFILQGKFSNASAHGEILTSWTVQFGCGAGSSSETQNKSQ
jgi:hypothetical protein